MIADYLFGPVAVTAWMVGSLVFVFCATWNWLLVREVGGLFSVALATTFSSLAVICICFALILMRQPWIADWLLGAIVSSAFVPIVFAALLLTDLHAARKNGHRSFTTKSYQWYQDLTKKDREGGPHHPISLGGRS